MQSIFQDSQLILGGRFRIVREIGRGGNGQVYLAQNLTLGGVSVAIKVLSVGSPLPSIIDAFQTEASRAAQLQHPNILSPSLYEKEAGVPLFIMPYCPTSLRSKLDALGDKGPMPLADALSMIEQIGKALAYAHNQPKPIVHRDVKPANILFDVHGNAMLADFGIAVIAHSTATMTTQQQSAGTLLYMPPEQLRGGSRPRVTVDQWALACVAYECLSNDLISPFDGGAVYQNILQGSPDPAQLAIPTQAVQALMRALEKDPAQRYPNVIDFVNTLKTACQGSMTAPALQTRPTATIVLSSSQTSTQSPQYGTSLPTFDPDENLAAYKKNCVLLTMASSAKLLAKLRQSVKVLGRAVAKEAVNSAHFIQVTLEDSTDNPGNLKQLLEQCQYVVVVKSTAIIAKLIELDLLDTVIARNYKGAAQLAAEQMTEANDPLSNLYILVGTYATSNNALWAVGPGDDAKIQGAAQNLVNQLQYLQHYEPPISNTTVEFTATTQVLGGLCSNCNNPLRLDAAFCNQCGATIVGTAQPNMTAPISNVVNWFVVYSYKDKVHFEALKRHTARKSNIVLVDIHETIGGDDFAEVVLRKYQECQQVLILLTPDYNADTSAGGKLQGTLVRIDLNEMEQKARVIHTRPTDTSIFTANQFLLDTQTTAVTQWPNSDQIWTDVATALAAI